jgi:molybdate transport system regulatory protein
MRTTMTSPSPSPLKIKAQVYLDGAIAIGPGKAAMLDAVQREGSIAAAGRSMGISYRRTRDMIDTLNRCWGEPVVLTEKGGRTGGGSRLTPRGQQVLAAYRALEQALNQTAAHHATVLVGLLGRVEPDI